MTSGYIQRALDKLPRQGAKRPWKLYQNYLLDFVMMKLRRLDDGALVFSNPPYDDCGLSSTGGPSPREKGGYASTSEA